MRIAIISDIHENYQNLLLFLEAVATEDVEQILFLGDFMNAGIARVLARSSYPVFAILGNNDGDRIAIVRESLREGSSLRLADEIYATLSLGGRNLFLTHHPQLVSSMAKSGDYDAVFFGHTHAIYLEYKGSCLILNPGEVSAHKSGTASYAIYDTQSNTAEVKILSDTVTVKTEQVAQLYERLGFNQHIQDANVLKQTNRGTL